MTKLEIDKCKKDCSSITCFSEWKDCFCGAPPTLNTIRRGFTALLQQAFASADNYSGNNSDLGCMVYGGAASNRINISAASVDDPYDTENVPGIVVSLGEGVRYQFPAMTDITTASADNSRLRVMTNGDVNITIQCYAWSADTACAMADQAMLFLMAVKPKVKQAWGWLKDYRPAAQTEPKLAQQAGAGTSTKWYGSTLTFSMQYDYSVISLQESKRLKDYSIEISTNINTNK